MTAPSPFAIAGARLRERDLSVMPCGPGTKFPGAYASATGWRPEYKWQAYCNALPTRFAMEIWERWPDAGICLALGRSSAPAGMQLVAVDIDTEEPAEVAAILAVLPGSPVRKRGAKGETQFYLAPDSVPNRPYNDANKRRMLDLLCHGRQTVLPPTIHPTTGKPYIWTTLDTLDNFDVADLPILPADIADRLSEALAPFGHIDAPKLERGSADPDAEISTHRQLNDAALSNLAAWVPDLSLYKCREFAGKYKAVSHWRPSSSGRPLSARATNLAISPDGIKDCGEGKGYTPLDLVMAATGGSLDEAFRFLQERVAPAEPIILPVREVPAVEPENVGQFRGNLAGLRLATFMGEPVQPGEVVGVEDAIAAKVPNAALNNAISAFESESCDIIIPAPLCTPPGALGDLVEWMNQSNDRPSPQLNLGAAIAFLGAIMGRRFAHPSKRARTNFYCVGVAPTGFGKGHALLTLKELARKAGLDKFLGPGRWKSESAVRKMMETTPATCCLVDELGGVMRDILGKKASEHRAGIRDILLDLFSAANTTYTGAVAAAEAATPIFNPNLCIYGASTPEDLWGNVSSAAATDGFLPRWLVFGVGDKRPDMTEVTADPFDPPKSLIKAIHGILDVRPGGNLNGIVGNEVITLPWGDGVEATFKALNNATERKIDMARTTGRRVEANVLSRYVEHVLKLSLIYAVGIDPQSPVISDESLQWGVAIADHSSRTMIAALEGKVADNDRQAEFLTVRGWIEEAGPEGILEATLTKWVKGRWDMRRHEDILGQLKAGGEIWREIRKPASGGRPGARVGMWHSEERSAI